MFATLKAGACQALRYLKARGCERSTWAGISAAGVAAAAVPAPWCYVIGIGGIAAALTPTGHDTSCP